jgi:hypothetical protein
VIIWMIKKTVLNYCSLIMNYELKHYLNSINYDKVNLMDNDTEAIRQYPPYIINRCFSGFMDTVLYANEMNMASHLDSKMQYDFYINSIRKRKRFSPWLKKDHLKDLEIVKQYYGYSNEKAKTALGLLTKEQLEFIKSKLNVGGKK